MVNRALGPEFTRLWSAFAVSAVGTSLALDAFPLIAIVVLHSGPGAVSALAATGAAVGAVAAIPLGPWVEFRRKRPVMIATDVVRCVALLSVPLAFALGLLSFAQLLIVSIVIATAGIVFRAASGAYLKILVPQHDLLVANGRFEATTWTTTALGPPLGGLAITVLGPVTTVIADMCSYLLSAVALSTIRTREPRPDRPATRTRPADIVAGWRYLLAHPTLRPLFLNGILVNALIMANAPVLAVLMLGRLGFSPWQYGLGFGIPCLAGLAGSRASAPLVERFGQRRILVVMGTLRACWPIGLAAIVAGLPGLLVVIVVESGLIGCIGVFTPVLATYRLQQTASDRVARTLTAWTVTGNATTALLTALWGVLAQLAGPRTALAVAGVLLLATPVLLIRGEIGTRQIADDLVLRSPSDRQARQVVVGEGDRNLAPGLPE
ncbi:major facilitator superfamily transporter [Nocardia nova SH22a]|uniref:Major facilitator superfamily transporter n=1 Tax=Nocardia nova SH22a TaxID=1415166 RepID=W5TYG3_9NOCA|nr:major facilitator superfamily transporter [Nocardia nova SH22a]